MLGLGVHGVFKSRIPCGMRGLKFTSAMINADDCDSRIPCGMRGLKSDHVLQTCGALFRRIPCGMRGLKFEKDVSRNGQTASHSLRNAWIEIFIPALVAWVLLCRIPCGMRGLKLPEI